MRIIMEQAGFEYRVASDRPIRSPEDAARAGAAIAAGETETFVILCLNARNGMKASEVVSVGIQDASLIHPREVFAIALEHRAAAIVLLHNHPSGDATPSAEDVKITRQLIAAGHIMDIPVLDHVVIGLGPNGLRWVSMREAGLVQFVKDVLT
jgi:DNA repair protein RadC